MTGAVLAGGLGTRLRSVLPDTAKTVAPVGGRPFLFVPLEQLARAGVSRIVLCTGYKADQVEEQIGREYRGIPVVYSREESPLGTGGALALAWRNHRSAEPWFVLNGDSFLDADLRAMAEAHGQAGLGATIAAVRAADGGRYGTLQWDERGRVTRFVEKGGASGPAWINGGIYVLAPEFLDAIGARVPLSLEREVFVERLAEGIGVFRCEGRFIDIGTPESYELAQTFFPAP